MSSSIPPSLVTRPMSNQVFGGIQSIYGAVGTLMAVYNSNSGAFSGGSTTGPTGPAGIAGGMNC